MPLSEKEIEEENGKCLLVENFILENKGGFSPEDVAEKTEVSIQEAGRFLKELYNKSIVRTTIKEIGGKEVTFYRK